MSAFKPSTLFFTAGRGTTIVTPELHPSGLETHLTTVTEDKNGGSPEAIKCTRGRIEMHFSADDWDPLQHKAPAVEMIVKLRDRLTHLHEADSSVPAPAWLAARGKHVDPIVDTQQHPSTWQYMARTADRGIELLPASAQNIKMSMDFQARDGAELEKRMSKAYAAIMDEMVVKRRPPKDGSSPHTDIRKSGK